MHITRTTSLMVSDCGGYDLPEEVVAGQAPTFLDVPRPWFLSLGLKIPWKIRVKPMRETWWENGEKQFEMVGNIRKWLNTAWEFHVQNLWNLSIVVRHGGNIFAKSHVLKLGNRKFSGEILKYSWDMFGKPWK